MSLLSGNPNALGIHEQPLFAAADCARIVRLVGDSPAWQRAGVYSGTREGSTVDLEERSARSVSLPLDDAGWPLSTIIEGLTTANDEYFRFDLVTVPADDAPSVMRYEADSADHFKAHRDAGPFAPTRKLTFTVQLSNPSDYIGGDLVFPDLGGTAPRAIGTLISFPSFEFHHVTPVLRGTRFAIVGWVHGTTLQ